jgi:uncharacterized membrane protein
MQWSDEKVEGIISALLRTGVIAAAATVLTGGLLYFVRAGGMAPDYHVFRGEPAGLRGVAGVLKGAGQGQALSVIQLGLLLLIATPVARVAFACVAFAMQRDRSYVVISLVVLAVLLYSLSGYGY